MHRPIHRFLSIVFALALASVTAACGTSSSSGSNGTGLLDEMRKTGAAKVALAQAPPLEYLTPDGKPAGYLVDLTRGLLSDLNVGDINATMTTFDAMIPALQARKYDFLPGGLNITAARCNAVAFTSPITVQHEALFVQRGNPKQLSGYAALAKSPDTTVALLAGSSQEAFAKQQGVSQGQMLTVPDIQAGIAAVTGGRADAFGVGQFSVQDPAGKGVDVVVDESSPVSGIGIAFRKEDAATRDAFNTVIEQWRADGRLAQLYTKWGYSNGDLLAKTTRATDVASACS
ncbi:ectoine/hydroxyectoine ABC transporter substrate-binding protein EhuB [Amycolatopsis sp. 3B14]|uniref:ectoine/hydroxyectoine ABC transporter substrate-binding protein EhuB n=1 Tax=Amycolatopsis sp. 3B14 TaxID=3243600 RepID=UPI003D97AA8D